MTIQATPSQVVYAGDGTTVAFAIPFPFDTSADIKVVQTDSDGEPDLLSTGYSITGGNGSTGTCTMDAAPAIGETLTICDDPELTQPADYTTNDSFPADLHEAALDRTVRQVKRLHQRVNRAIRVEDGDNSDGNDLLLPLEADRAGKFLAFDANGNPTAASGTSGADDALRTDLAAGNPGLVHSDAVAYERTAGELAASVTPDNYANPPGDLYRIGENTAPGTTAMASALQDAIDAASDEYPEIRIRNVNRIESQIRIEEDTARVKIQGNARVTSILRATGVSLAEAPENVNALFLSKGNNSHLCMYDMRFASAGGYTGVGIYAKEAGGDDGSAQCLFSSLFQNIWFDMGSGAANFLTGATQNSSFETITFENAKGCFTFEGIGNSDNHYSNLSLYNCFDQLALQTADTDGSYYCHWSSINVYQHNRGRLFDVQNWLSCTVSNVSYAAKAGNLGDTGIGRWKNCDFLTITNTNAYYESGVARVDTVHEVEASTRCCVQFIGGKWTGDIGLLISGTGEVDIELIGVDMTGCGTAAIRVNGAVSGNLKTIGCKMNNTDGRSMLHSVSNSLNWTDFGSEILNAGLTAGSGARNIVLDTSGRTLLYGTRIGQNDGDADAGYYLDNVGAGVVELHDVEWVGTPPTGYITGAGAAAVKQITGISGGTKTFQLNSAASSVTVNDTDVTADCLIVVTPTNAAASVVQGSAQHLRISARTAGTSFQMTTGDGSTAAGNSTFAYRVIR